MIFIPSRISEIVDFLGYMMLYAPHDFEPEDRMDLALAFATVRAGLDKVRGRLGEERYPALIRMGEEAKALYEAGDERGGVLKLQDMQELLGHR